MDILDMRAEDLDYVRDLVRGRSAIVLEDEKAYLVQSRLGILARNEDFPSLHDMVDKLRKTVYGPLHQKVVEALTTNETSFFRDPGSFQALRDHVLPEIIQNNAPIKRVHIWCGAGSSGQEPYSILLTILDHFPELKSWSLRMVATDISQGMIQRCREGTYSRLEVDRGLSVSHLDKYFIQEGGAWRIRSDVRRMIEFHVMNLAEPWLLFSVMDIVFLRNVMIYFDVKTKRQILKKVREILAPHGYLFLGGTETTINVDHHFQRVGVCGTSVYRIKQKWEETHAVS